MPLVQIKGLPAVSELKAEWEQEGRYDLIVPEDMTGSRKVTEIAILNLMPVKERTERQLLRRLAMSKELVHVTFLMTETYHPKHADPEHLSRFYTVFSAVRDYPFDGMIITGAPIEMMAFEDVNYWQELTGIMDSCRQKKISTMYICWGAQAALYHFYGIPKKPLPAKQFGIFEHHLANGSRLSEGMEDPFFTPHSRHTFTDKQDVVGVSQLKIVAESPKAGVYLMVDEEHREVFVTGHSEYDADTLSFEYFRDLGKGLPIDVPEHYFPDDDPSKEPISIWRDHSEKLFENWLTYYINKDDLS
ncbi:MAG: homoserine O-succinyltransferase [Firmicutes bacterium]|nr:homoserine O-succinyltransferase [Bacillota bacterium]